MIMTASLHPQKAAAEPPDSCSDESRGERQEENHDNTAERRELVVRSRIESPETIKRRASPEQSSRGKSRHHGAEKQENPDRGKSSRFRRDRVLHLLNLNLLALKGGDS
jgi:hypothetical protein